MLALPSRIVIPEVDFADFLSVAVFTLGVSNKKEENNRLNGTDTDLCVSAAHPQRSSGKEHNHERSASAAAQIRLS